MRIILYTSWTNDVVEYFARKLLTRINNAPMSKKIPSPSQSSRKIKCVERTHNGNIMYLRITPQIFNKYRFVPFLNEYCERRLSMTRYTYAIFISLYFIFLFRRNICSLCI